MTNLEPGSIVVAVDGSPEADRAAQWAAEQAHLEQRPLVVIAAERPVVPVAYSLGPAYDYQVEDLLEAGKSVARDAAAAARRHRPDVSVTTRAYIGEPREVLVALSEHAHLLVLGSRGRGPLRSKLLGSVSAGVIKHAQCPVIVCRPGTEFDVKHGVVVGADGTAASLPVIDFAFRQASLRGQPLTVVHCFWDVLAGVDSPRLIPDTDPAAETNRLLLAESVAGFRERYPDVHVTLKIARGKAAECLAAIADRHNLVVVGRHPVDSFARRLTSTVSTEVSEHSHTAVAVVPEEWTA